MSGPERTPVLLRLMRRMEISPEGCLLWTGCLNESGYGKIGVRAGVTRAGHRVAWMAVYGTAPEVLDHICHDPLTCPGGSTCPHRRCFNVDHLRPSTRADNNSPARSRIAESNRERGRAIVACKRGHVYDETTTHVDRRGFRSCKVCARMRKAGVLS